MAAHIPNRRVIIVALKTNKVLCASTGDVYTDSPLSDSQESHGEQMMDKREIKDVSPDKADRFMTSPQSAELTSELKWTNTDCFDDVCDLERSSVEFQKPTECLKHAEPPTECLKHTEPPEYVQSTEPPCDCLKPEPPFGHCPHSTGLHVEHPQSVCPLGDSTQSTDSQSQESTVPISPVTSGEGSQSTDPPGMCLKPVSSPVECLQYGEPLGSCSQSGLLSIDCQRHEGELSSPTDTSVQFMQSSESNDESSRHKGEFPSPPDTTAQIVQTSVSIDGCPLTTDVLTEYNLVKTLSLDDISDHEVPIVDLHEESLNNSSQSVWCNTDKDNDSNIIHMVPPVEKALMRNSDNFQSHHSLLCRRNEGDTQHEYNETQFSCDQGIPQANKNVDPPSNQYCRISGNSSDEQHTNINSKNSIYHRICGDSITSDDGNKTDCMTERESCSLWYESQSPTKCSARFEATQHTSPIESHEQQGLHRDVPHHTIPSGYPQPSDDSENNPSVAHNEWHESATQYLQHNVSPPSHFIPWLRRVYHNNHPIMFPQSNLQNNVAPHLVTPPTFNYENRGYQQPMIIPHVRPTHNVSPPFYVAYTQQAATHNQGCSQPMVFPYVGIPHVFPPFFSPSPHLIPISRQIITPTSTEDQVSHPSAEKITKPKLNYRISSDLKNQAPGKSCKSRRRVAGKAPRFGGSPYHSKLEVSVDKSGSSAQCVGYYARSQKAVRDWLYDTREADPVKVIEVVPEKMSADIKLSLLDEPLVYHPRSDDSVKSSPRNRRLDNTAKQNDSVKLKLEVTESQ